MARALGLTDETPELSAKVDFETSVVVDDDP